VVRDLHIPGSAWLQRRAEARFRHSRHGRGYVVSIGALLLVIGLLAGIKACQIGKLVEFGDTMERAGPPPEAVSSATAQIAAWDVTLDAVGSITGAERVAVSNEVPGTVIRIRFESGDVVPSGRALVELDASTERAQLAAARARRDLAQVVAERSRFLFGVSAIPRDDLDRAEAALATAVGEMEALAAQIDRKTVRAPFSGRLGIRAVDLGQYLAPGSTITTLESLATLFVDFSVPQQELSRLRVGLPVRIELQGSGRHVDGKLVAIDPALDFSAARSADILRSRASALGSTAGLPAWDDCSARAASSAYRAAPANADAARQDNAIPLMSSSRT
jgi:membrane fusion protein (multidrug efflux system)